MRLYERALKPVYIAPGIERRDELGGVNPAFSQERVAARASLIPCEGTLQRREAGQASEAKCLALFPLDAPIAPGDGVGETAGEPEWLCADVRRWSAHLAATLVRRAWP